MAKVKVNNDARIDERLNQLEQQLASLQARQEQITSSSSEHQQEVRQAPDLDARLVTWLRARELDLRRLIFSAYPVELRILMHQDQDGFWRGRTGDRYLVKISLDDWNKVMEEEAESIRQIDKANQEGTGHPIWDALDSHFGIERASKDSPWDTEMMLADKIASHLRSLINPEWWLFKPQNQARGEQDLLP